MKKWLGAFLAVSTAAINWYVYYRIMLYFKIPDPAFFSTAFMIAIIFHELGHFTAFKAYGIRSHILFLVIGAVTVSSKKDRGKVEALNPESLMVTFLAGVLGNVALMMLSVPFFWLHIIHYNQFIFTTYLNAFLIVINLAPLPLLPFLTLDGDGFMRSFFSGIRKSKILPYAFIVLLAFLALTTALRLALGPAANLTSLGFFCTALIGIPIRVFLRLKAYKRYPEWYLEAHLTEPRSRKKWIAFYLFLVFISLVSVALTINRVS